MFRLFKVCAIPEIRCAYSSRVDLLLSCSLIFPILNPTVNWNSHSISYCKFKPNRKIRKIWNLVSWSVTHVTMIICHILHGHLVKMVMKKEGTFFPELKKKLVFTPYSSTAWFMSMELGAALDVSAREWYDSFKISYKNHCPHRNVYCPDCKKEESQYRSINSVLLFICL